MVKDEVSMTASMLASTASAAILLAIGFVELPRLRGQQSIPKFQVDSVRLNRSGIARYNVNASGNRFAATNYSLFALVEWAYDMEDFRISGGPPWVKSSRFDIVAESEGAPSMTQFRVMLQPPLADRFGLKIHRGTKKMPVYELRVAKGGSKLKEGKCIGTPSPANPCGGTSGSSRGTLFGRAASVPVLAKALSGILSRPVLDKAKLGGEYDFDLTYTPDETFRHGPGDPDDPASDINAPSIFTAVQEQLGLTLKSAKGLIDVLVIDHAELPAEN
jgi:uncharacterized protein (TIGR03435 family)